MPLRTHCPPGTGGFYRNQAQCWKHDTLCLCTPHTVFFMLVVWKGSSGFAWGASWGKAEKNKSLLQREQSSSQEWRDVSSGTSIKKYCYQQVAAVLYVPLWIKGMLLHNIFIIKKKKSYLQLLQWDLWVTAVIAGCCRYIPVLLSVAKQLCVCLY